MIDKTVFLGKLYTGAVGCIKDQAISVKRKRSKKARTATQDRRHAKNGFGEEGEVDAGLRADTNALRKGWYNGWYFLVEIIRDERRCPPVSTAMIGVVLLEPRPSKIHLGTFCRPPHGLSILSAHF